MKNPEKVRVWYEKVRVWYEKNRRDLPWRSNKDPYPVWLSEVILQQTRIDQGTQYYHRFLQAFPDVAALAAANEEEVLKIWEGLGYYSRARNLHRAAREVMERFGGKIPGTYDDLLGLKGIGPYTAAAIASICFGEPKAVVDGNVARVIARFFGVEEAVNSTAGAKIISRLASEMLDLEDPGNHNQAMMEFGALQCIPVKPGCGSCPLQTECIAFRTGQVARLPVKNPARKPVERWMYFYIIRCGHELVLTRRGTDDIWGGLYQFPMIETLSELEETEIIRRLSTDLLNHTASPRPDPNRETSASGEISASGENSTSPRPDLTIGHISPVVRHQLTHRTLRARFIHVAIGKWPEPLPGGWMKISFDRMDDFPVPRLINRYMEVMRNSYL